MYIVKLTDPGFPVSYVSNFSYRGYERISEVTSSQVRDQAYRFFDRAQAQEAAAAAKHYSEQARAEIEEIA
jgi:hypothetical protein